MYKTKISPEKVIIWEHERTTKGLEELAREGGLEKIPALAFETPYKYRFLGKYVLFDGHHRREAARKVGVDLPLIILERPADFKEIPGYGWTNLNRMSDREFMEFVEKYIQAHFKYEQRKAEYWEDLDFHPF